MTNFLAVLVLVQAVISVLFIRRWRACWAELTRLQRSLYSGEVFEEFPDLTRRALEGAATDGEVADSILRKALAADRSSIDVMKRIGIGEARFVGCFDSPLFDIDEAELAYLRRLGVFEPE